MGGEEGCADVGFAGGSEAEGDGHYFRFAEEEATGNERQRARTALLL